MNVDVPVSVLAAVLALPWTLLGLAVRMIYKGQLVPATLHREVRANGEIWRAAFEQERLKNDRLTRPVAELQAEVLRAIPSTPAQGHGAD